jgi:hypothetical protein
MLLLLLLLQVDLVGVATTHLHIVTGEVPCHWLTLSERKNINWKVRCCPAPVALRLAAKRRCNQTAYWT